MSKSIGYIIVADGKPLTLWKGELFFGGDLRSPITLFCSLASARGAIKRTNEERRQYNVKYGHGDVTFEAEFGKCSIYRVESEI